MKQNGRNVFWYTLVLAVGVSLSGCSNLSETMSSAISSINPFQQRAKEAPSAATPPVAAPANEKKTVQPAASIRVEAKPPAPRQRHGEVAVNVGDNKKCTTFCALPMRKPPAAH